MDNLFWLLEAIPLVPLIAAVFYGVYRMFRRRVPLYFQMVVCAVICALLELVYSSLVLLCGDGGSVPANLTGLAAGGACAFMFAANYGQFDSIVDGGQKKYRTVRLLALFAPAVFLAAAVLFFLAQESIDVVSFIVIVIAVFSLLPCSYFNFKIILMQDDGTGFIKGAKPANVASLVYIVLQCAAVYLRQTGNDPAMLVVHYLIVLTCIAGVFCADWGRKQWVK